jgi:hypothetical protein
MGKAHSRRFGLVHVNFEIQARIIKKIWSVRSGFSIGQTSLIQATRAPFILQKMLNTGPVARREA